MVFMLAKLIKKNYVRILLCLSLGDSGPENSKNGKTREIKYVKKIFFVKLRFWAWQLKNFSPVQKLIFGDF